MSPYLYVALCFLPLAYSVYVAIMRHRARKREEQEYNDAVDDPAVQAMLRECIRTGRPMVMNRGEAPRFIDKPDEPET
jgi:hypothetical protein